MLCKRMGKMTSVGNAPAWRTTFTCHLLKHLFQSSLKQESSFELLLHILHEACPFLDHALVFVEQGRNIESLCSALQSHTTNKEFVRRDGSGVVHIQKSK